MIGVMIRLFLVIPLLTAMVSAQCDNCAALALTNQPDLELCVHPDGTVSFIDFNGNSVGAFSCPQGDDLVVTTSPGCTGSVVGALLDFFTEQSGVILDASGNVIGTWFAAVAGLPCGNQAPDACLPGTSFDPNEILQMFPQIASIAYNPYVMESGDCVHNWITYADGRGGLNTCLICGVGCNFGFDLNIIVEGNHVFQFWVTTTSVDGTTATSYTVGGSGYVNQAVTRCNSAMSVRWSIDGGPVFEVFWVCSSCVY